MKKEKEKLQHYSMIPLLHNEAHYYIIVGERSNGKSFQVKFASIFGLHENGVNLDGYLDNGKFTAVLRRWDEDFKGKNGAQFYEDITNNEELGNILEKKTRGKWNSIYYFSRQWFLQRTNKDGEIEERDNKPFAIAFSLNSEERYKSNSYPNLNFIHFEEFITRHGYLIDEFVTFTNVLSTLIRLRDDVKIFMCGNTISPYNPYYVEMGLKRAKFQQKGTIDVYKYNALDNTTLTVAIEYTDMPSKKKPSNVYFAFDNPKLQMITDGKYELAYYPHLPMKYVPKDVIYTYYIIFDQEIFTCEIIQKDEIAFTFIHRKTKPIDKDTRSVVYQQDFDPRPNYCRKITKPHSKIEMKIAEFFIKEKVYYQDNEVGETINQYLQWSRT